jgi:hypothetical protein
MMGYDLRFKNNDLRCQVYGLGEGTLNHIKVEDIL